jgi:hypothetical protein
MSRPLSDANRIKVNSAVGNKESGIVVLRVACSSCYLLAIGCGLLACLWPSDCRAPANKGFFACNLLM